MLDESKVVLSELFENRIKALHNDKLKINEDKIKALGAIDVDDHGFIHYPDFKFTPTNNIEDDTHTFTGKVVGMKAIGKNFRRFLNEMPKYANKNSALATCWVGLINNYMKLGFSPEDFPYHLKKEWDKFNILQPGCGAMNHLAPDMTIGLKLGWQGLINKVQYYKALNDPVNTEFYDGELQLLYGIQEWILQTAEHAYALSEKEENETHKENLLYLGAMNEKLAYNPPETFREVCQFLAHFQSIDRMYFAGGSLCQLDEVLLPYYICDIHKGILTDEEAVWCIASLFFNDTHYSQIAGLIPDGSRDKTNRVSFLVLEAMHLLNIPANIALRVSPLVNETLLKRSIQYTIEDGSGVDYSLNKGIEEGFAKNGYPIQLARLRGKLGCNWVALPGIEYPLQDVTRVNLALPLTLAIDELKASNNKSLDFIWDRFIHYSKHMIDVIKEGYDWHYEYISRNTPEIVLNLFMHGPIERGLNCAEGGVDIINFCIDGIGLATVADSFAAIEQRVIEEKKLTFDELNNAIDNNFENMENIRLMLKNINRFGNPNSKAEKWAIQVKDFFVDYCKTPTKKHNLQVIPGMFSHGDVYMYGKNLKATPNGRFNNDPISHSNEPDPGFAFGINSFSPTLKATAVAKVQPGYGNSSPLHLDIDKKLLNANGGIDAVAKVIHAHNEMGGTLINLNCLSKEKLLDAHENPEKYPDLVVRVTGYSAFFCSLSKEYRQQIVDRFLD